MNILFNKNKIKEGVNVVEKALSKNLSLPALENIFLSVNKNKLILKATNLEIGVEVDMSIQSDVVVDFLVKGGVLSSFINNLSNKDEKGEINIKGEDLTIKSNNSSIKIKSTPVDDFPIIPKIKDGKSVMLNIEQFVFGVKSVIYSASLSDIKPEISSVYIYQDGQHLVFVATDSFRLAEKRVLIDKNTEIEPIIIPFKNISEIIKIINEKNGVMEVKTNKNQISLSMEGLYITSRLIDSVFPDYRQIIPKEFKTKILIEKEDLIQGVKMVNIFSDKLNKVKISINKNDNTFKISSHNNDVGDIESEFVVKEIDGENIEIILNGRYLAEVLPVISKNEVRFNFSDLNKPLIIENNNDDSFKYLVMPMNK